MNIIAIAKIIEACSADPGYSRNRYPNDWTTVGVANSIDELPKLLVPWLTHEALEAAELHPEDDGAAEVADAVLNAPGDYIGLLDSEMLKYRLGMDYTIIVRDGRYIAKTRPAR
jgi:hypothetical protein